MIAAAEAEQLFKPASFSVSSVSKCRKEKRVGRGRKLWELCKKRVSELCIMVLCVRKANAWEGMAVGVVVRSRENMASQR